MITHIYMDTGAGMDTPFPVHHYEFRDTCYYYLSNVNPLIIPEVYSESRSALCLCYSTIQYKFQQLLNKGRPASILLPPLTPTEAARLNWLLESVARANMSSRLSGRVCETLWQEEIPGIDLAAWPA